ISAAATGRPEACTSEMPLSSICQARDNTRIDSCAAKARPRVRSVSESETSSETDGTTLTRVTKCVNSARSLRTTAGSAPMSYCSRNSRNPPQGRVPPALHQPSDRVDPPHPPGETEHRRAFSGAPRPRRMRDGLIEEGERIAHRAFGRARNQCQRSRLDLNFLFCGDAFEVLHQK